MDTRVREHDGVVLIDRLFLHLALRRHTRSEERTIWYPFLQRGNSEYSVMDTRIREYDGVV
jgi:hypothetical protein